MKGEVRNPTTTWLLSFLCGVYGLYWLYLVNTELKNYLGKDELNPVLEVLMSLVCLPVGLFRLGEHIQEAQQRAGMPNAENQGMNFLIWFFLCGMGYLKAQEELNKVWEGGGSAPATF